MMAHDQPTPLPMKGASQQSVASAEPRKNQKLVRNAKVHTGILHEKQNATLALFELDNVD
jgi:hypothetical protein